MNFRIPDVKPPNRNGLPMIKISKSPKSQFLVMEMTVIEQDLKDNSSFNISAISAVDPDTVSYKIHIFFILYPNL